MQVFNGTLYVKNKNIWYSYSGSPIGTDVGLGSRSEAVFSAEMNGDQTLSSTLSIVEFDVVLIDTVRGFSESTYKYSVQTGYEGYYFVGGDIAVEPAAGIYVQVEISQDYIDGSTSELWKAFVTPHDSAITTWNSVGKGAIFLASAGDTFKLKSSVGTGTPDILHANTANFYGFKIG